MRMRERLVFRGERRGGHVRNHETRVDAALLDEKRRQAREISVHQQRDPAFGKRADLRDRERKIVGSEGDRLGVKVAAGKYRDVFIFVDKDERIVRHRIRLDEQHRRRVAHLVETRAHHLRLTAQTVRVLHAWAVDV